MATTKNEALENLERKRTILCVTINTLRKHGIDSKEVIELLAVTPDEFEVCRQLIKYHDINSLLTYLQEELARLYQALNDGAENGTYELIDEIIAEGLEAENLHCELCEYVHKTLKPQLGKTYSDKEIIAMLKIPKNPLPALYNI